MAGSILGTSVRRVEDLQLITGASTYVGNLALDGVLHAAFVRSPLAHARILGIDTTEAKAAPGVVAVFTAADLGLPAHHGLMVVNPDLPRPPLATDRVRFVGEAVAVVIGETKAAAVDAAELVEVDYDPLPAVIDLEAALDPASEPQFPDLGSNVAAGARSDNAPLADAEVVVRARMVNQRLAVMPMEGNAIAVLPGPWGEEGANDELTIWVSTQMPHGFRNQTSAVLGLDADRVRVITPHVGGGFGGKAGLLAEHTVVIGAARALGRPVTWVETRSENLVSMPHGRAQVGYYELGLTREGVITGMRARVVADAGAYAGFNGGLVMGPTYLMSQGVYRMPKIGFDAAAALTNTTPVGAFRGAGRPEATAYLERMMDLAADELGLDPVEIRRRNFIQPTEFPFTTIPGANYDIGDYDLPLREALRLVDYEKVREEQATRREAGDPVMLGIGVSVYVEITAGGGGTEFGSVTVHADGSATISAGTSGHGQGHPTAFAMLASDRLGIPMEKIRFVQSDTAAVPRGGGTGGSRSLQMGGNAVRAAAEDVLEQARRRAAAMLEASVDDVQLTEDGEFGVAGVPSVTLTWAQVAGAAENDGAQLAAALDFRQEGATFPFGAHVSVVEVDTETGRVTPRRHVAVDDCGRILNPLLVNGQQHGGLAQGIAQALYEEIVYDSEGQPLTGTLADYRMPSAADLFTFETANTETPTPMNPLGAKGIGESATVGATPAVQNAVVDALRPLGVRHVDLPCTPERVWRAVQDARSGHPADLWREPPAAFASLPVRPGGEVVEGGEI
ncbi:xanthine dehydrogenase family protein molybdopterin-binding subunit [Pseudonocardia alaniniphila]|uniref:Xanthine dehydrogenase family protein molybdopterin-binding subunit n=1 Tax=Pseudonocardia alaniniphila TaxID=75291 RepID=A0ABS9TC48_9PSEU|nr:xanthine dehydrogenase family protein molybdopterin-binding subunit [Pseudonocardia alaniniphila]MCH6166087.1 xanthine dehydrogenase family protein molybdopterin-binding subunit [Pseudonocardia alaniniphila]